MATMYRLKLIRLECLASHEVDGDEVYLTLDGARLWTAHPDKASHHAEHSHQVSEFDFAAGRKRTRAGWELMTPFNPGDFVVRGLTTTARLQLWDADPLTRHELLGETPIRAADAGHGNISIVFQRDGGHYRLTYAVELESA
jgi:hypothetical protein